VEYQWLKARWHDKKWQEEKELMGRFIRNYGRKFRSFMLVTDEKNWHPRLRAEVLLDSDERGEIVVTAEEREQLNRICVAPNDEDDLWLRRFDKRLEALQAATTFTNDDLSACAEREVERRLLAYPLRVAAKLLTEKEARREIAMMERIAEHFRALDVSERIIE
jgi:hypothetical protein